MNKIKQTTAVRVGTSTSYKHFILLILLWLVIIITAVVIVDVNNKIRLSVTNLFFLKGTSHKARLLNNKLLAEKSSLTNFGYLEAEAKKIGFTAERKKEVFVSTEGPSRAVLEIAND